jgi:hypothetical protein
MQKTRDGVSSAFYSVTAALRTEIGTHHNIVGILSKNVISY